MRLVTMAELATTRERRGILPYSRQHIHRLITAGKFPKPIKLSEGQRGRIAFDLDEVEARIASAKAARTGTGSAPPIGAIDTSPDKLA